MKDWNNLGTPIEHRPMPQSPVIGADDANNLMEAIKRNTTKIVEKSNDILAEYIRHLQEKNKALDEELALLRNKADAEIKGR